MDSNAVKDYYAQLKDVNIGDIATELMPGRLTHTNSHILLFNCPNHASHSKKSLQVDINKQLWNCFGCGVGGDVLHLVEFIRSGSITAHTNGQMPESHRSARDWLATKNNMLPLSRHGMTPEELQQAEEEQTNNEKALACLEAAIGYWHHRLTHSLNIEPLTLLKSKYALSDTIISTLKIGYTDSSPYTDTSGHAWPTLFDHIESLDFTTDDMLSCGIAFLDKKDHTLRKLRFINRFSFPYLCKGKPHYLICRHTPWSQDGPSKYKKLPVYDEHQNSEIARVFSNDILFNEDVLLSKPDYIIITEGVTDCIAGMDRGLPCVAPVTTTIKRDDWARILPKFAEIPRVYLCQDNEISQAGLTGAIRNARVLINNGSDARLIILPPDAPHIAARQEVAERWGITETLTQKEITQKKQALPAEEQEEFLRLAEAAKVDLNSFFAAGHTTEEFQSLLSQALAPVEFAISRLPRLTEESVAGTENAESFTIQQWEERLNPIISEIAEYPVIHWKLFFQTIIKQIGKIFTAKELNDYTRDLHKTQAARQKASLKKNAITVSSPAGSLRHVIESQISAFNAQNQPIDHEAIAAAMWSWFADQGGSAFKLPSGDVKFAFAGRLFATTSPHRNERAEFLTFINQQAKLLQRRQTDAAITEALLYQLRRQATSVDELGWLYSDEENFQVFLNLNNADNEIVRISPDGVAVLTNGNNPDGVYLADTPAMKPIIYQPGTTNEAIGDAVQKHILNMMACAPEEAAFLWLWLCAYPLLKFTSTRPLLRFEGDSNSGKSAAQRILTTLIFGEEYLQQSTVAAAYASGQTDPFIALDNLEPQKLTHDLTQFLLVTASGIGNTKRAQGTDSGVITERPHCLIFSSGVNPIGAELQELVNRTFLLTFDRSYRRNDGPFIEFRIKADIRKYRDAILSWIFDQTAKVLSLIQSGGMDKAKALIEQELPNHIQDRCDDYLAIMYLYQVASSPAAELTALEPWFRSVLLKLHGTSGDQARDANPIVTCIDMLFQKWDNLQNQDFGVPDTDAFRSKYLVTIENERTTPAVPTTVLLGTLTRVGRDSGYYFPYTSPAQLGARLHIDREAIAASGFEVHQHKGAKNRNIFTIERTT